MYSSNPPFVYGFHGTDKEAALKILLHEDKFRHKNNKYDCIDLEHCLSHSIVFRSYLTYSKHPAGHLIPILNH